MLTETSIMRLLLIGPMLITITILLMQRTTIDKGKNVSHFYNTIFSHPTSTYLLIGTIYLCASGVVLFLPKGQILRFPSRSELQAQSKSLLEENLILQHKLSEEAVNSKDIERLILMRDHEIEKLKQKNMQLESTVARIEHTNKLLNLQLKAWKRRVTSNESPPQYEEK